MNKMRWRGVTLIVASSLVMAACAPAPATSSGDENPFTTAEVSQVPPTTQEAMATPSIAADPSPSTDAIVQLRPDSIAVSRVNDLRMRSAPGTAADQVSTMDAGTRLFVLAGPATDPVDPDLVWWEVVPYACSPIDDEPATGDCGYDPRIGWVTSGPEGLWVEPFVPDQRFIPLCQRAKRCAVQARCRTNAEAIY